MLYKAKVAVCSGNKQVEFLNVKPGSIQIFWQLLKG
jgi:hypothetical protein